MVYEFSSGKMIADDASLGEVKDFFFFQAKRMNFLTRKWKKKVFPFVKI